MYRLKNSPPWLAGIEGAIFPYLAIFLVVVLIEPFFPEAASDISEVTGILGTLFCPPTILVGAVFGWLGVGLVEKFEKPAWLNNRLQQADDNSWRFYIAFTCGLITGPILGALIFIAALALGSA